MNGKQFQRYLDRDGGCVHCGDIETAVPHHRANRGMGGSKSRDVPSNIVAICSQLNGLMESNAVVAAYAARNGWKLQSWEDHAKTPIWNANLKKWFILNDSYGKEEIEDADNQRSTFF